MRANWYHTNFKRIWTTIIYLFKHDHNILPCPDLTFGVDIICSALGSGFDFIMLQVQCIFFGWSGSGLYLFWVRSGFYHVSPVRILSCQSGSGFYLFWVRYGFYHASPDFIYFESESGSGLPMRFRILSIFWVRVRIFSIKSGSRYYLILSLGPDFIKHGRVRILPTPGSSFHNLYTEN